MTQTAPTVTGPDFLAFQVSNLRASREFWTQTVGLTPTPQAPPGAVVFATQPVAFGITSPKVDLGASTRLGWGVSVWMHTPDADALHARLKARNVTIVAPPSTGAFGRQFTFADPDGYTVVAHDGK